MDTKNMTKNRLHRITLVGTVLVIAALVYLWQCQHRPFAVFPAEAEQLLKPFKDPAPPSQEAYADLFHYFVEGVATYRSDAGATVAYPGIPSHFGQFFDRLEGFSRTAPLLAAWLHGGRPGKITLSNGEIIDLAEWLKQGIVAGTDPDSAEYWGEITHWKMSVLEASDIALTLWLSRDQVWAVMSPLEKKNVADWLFSINGKGFPDNNWHLAIVMVNAVLATLNAPHDPENMEIHYSRFRSYYVGDGWFSDGPEVTAYSFDYYNAWQMHYNLHWIRDIRPELDGAFIDTAFAEFLPKYKFLFGPNGFPIMGRSICYRMAAPVALVQGQARHGDLMAAGVARRALDATWQYFIRNNALRNGNVTQGYCEADPRVIDPYSGPASCLWALRSLVAAFAFSPEHPFWTSAPMPLPVEQSDFKVVIPAIGWEIEGNHETHNITLHTVSKASSKELVLTPHTLVDQLIEFFTCKAHRPKNFDVKYLLPAYHSNPPFCGCTGQADNPPKTSG
jgi:hypothetical protein